MATRKNITRTLSSQDLIKNHPGFATASDEWNNSLPHWALEGEAVDVARFVDAWWDDRKLENGTVVRGLNSVADPNRQLTGETAEELRTLERAAHELHQAYRAALGPNATNDDLDRARVLVNKLDAVLGWYFADGREDASDAEFTRLRNEHSETPDNTDALAAELDDYATLSSKHRDAIEGLGGFDASMIEEAKTLSQKLRERPAMPERLSPEARNALSLRNRAFNLLYRRMMMVRAAARFVFQDHPEIVRLATSQHERRKRAASRRKAAKENGTSVGVGRSIE